MSVWTSSGNPQKSYSRQLMQGWYGNWYHAGRYYFGAEIDDLAATTSTRLLNLLYMHTFIAPNRDCTIDQVALNVTVAGVAPAGAVVGIYHAGYMNQQQKYNRACGLIAQSAVMDCSTTGVKTSAISASIEANELYFVALNLEKTITLRTMQNASSVGRGYLDDIATMRSWLPQGPNMARTYSATMPGNLAYTGVDVAEILSTQTNPLSGSPVLLRFT